MKVELSSETARWVESEIGTGRFATAEAAIDFAVEQTKVSNLRTALDAAEREGGAFDTDDVRRFAADTLDHSADSSSR